MIDSKNQETENGRANQDAKKTALKSSQLMKLFEDQLKDIHWAEKVLLKALPKMIENASLAN